MARNANDTYCIERILERMDNAKMELIDCMHELEDCHCRTQIKKLDTICGKLENLEHELSKKLK